MFSVSWRRLSYKIWLEFSSVQLLSRVQLCDPMNRSTPGLPVHYQLPEFTQTHAHRVGDAIQPSHPLLSPSPPAPNPSQHQGWEITFISYEAAITFASHSNPDRTSLVAQTVKHLLTMRETWVRSLGREDPLEKEVAPHSSTLAWKIPWTEEPGRLQSIGLQESDTTERLHIHHILLLTEALDRFSYFAPF